MADPVVRWRDDGTPFSPRFGDVYRSAGPAGALAQARHALRAAQLQDLLNLGEVDAQVEAGGGNHAAQRARVHEALERVGMGAFAHASIAALSNGQFQRVLLARALAVQAQVLLMDEPLANLDPPHQADWLLLVRALVAEGKTVVSVLHEVSMALQADHVAVLARGRIVHHGAAADPDTHRAVERVFDHRIAIHSVAGQWMALPRLHPTAAPPSPDLNENPSHAN